MPVTCVCLHVTLSVTHGAHLALCWSMCVTFMCHHVLHAVSQSTACVLIRLFAQRSQYGVVPVRMWDHYSRLRMWYRKHSIGDDTRYTVYVECMNLPCMKKLLCFDHRYTQHLLLCAYTHEIMFLRGYVSVRVCFCVFSLLCTSYGGADKS